MSVTANDPEIDRARKTAGANLRKARHAAGLSQKKFGILLGVELDRREPMPGNEISRYEHGKRMPALRTKIAMSKVLGRPLSLFDEEPDA